MRLKAGAALGAFRIVGELGRGGMGVVYKAYQPSLDRFVAIKVLPAFFAEDERLRARFKREAVTIAQLDHPAILPVYEYVERGLRSYIVMALAEGGTLAAQAEYPMPVEAAIRLLAPVADALDYAHGKGILHRDVKPANVLLRRDGRPLLSDFGLARSADADAKLTQSGVALGTPDYMAPELWRGEPAGPASDQYSLAVLCHELMTGRLPFPTSTVDLTNAAVVNRQPDLSQAPVATRAALARALSKSDKDRFATCSEFIQALLPEAVSLTKPRARRQALAVGAAVVLALLIGGALLVMRGDPLSTPAAHSVPPRSQAAHTISVLAGLQGLKSPSALTVGADGSLYVADTSNNQIWKVNPAGNVSVIARDLHSPSGVAVDSSGAVFISETGSNQVVMVDPLGALRVYAGDGKAGSAGDDGPATSAELSAPASLAFQPRPNPTSSALELPLWIVDRGNNKLRQVLTDGTIVSPITLTAKGGAFDPRLDSSAGIAFTPDSTGSWLYLSSAGANQLFSRSVGSFPVSRSCQQFYCMAVVAGTGESGLSGDSGDATKTTLNHPGGIAINKDSDVYVADTGNNRIRLVDRAGKITTVVGGGSNPTATKPDEIQLNAPEAVALAPDGTLYIADTGNQRILKLAP